MIRKLVIFSFFIIASLMTIQEVDATHPEITYTGSIKITDIEVLDYSYDAQTDALTVIWNATITGERYYNYDVFEIIAYEHENPEDDIRNRVMVAELVYIYDDDNISAPYETVIENFEDNIHYTVDTVWIGIEASDDYGFLNSVNRMQYDRYILPIPITTGCIVGDEKLTVYWEIPEGLDPARTIVYAWSFTNPDSYGSFSTSDPKARSGEIKGNLINGVEYEIHVLYYLNDKRSEFSDTFYATPRFVIVQ